MSAFFPILQLLVVLIVVCWDVVITGKIAQVKTLPRAFIILTALAGFLLIPALVIHLATGNAITGRSVLLMNWLWPFTVCLFALQALYAALKRLVNPFLGFFISAYDLLLAIDVVLRDLAASGQQLPNAALVFLATTSGAFAFITRSSTIISSPFFFFVPMTAPAFPALRRFAATFRVFLASLAFAWIVIFFSQILAADQAVRSYDIHDTSVEKLQERPKGDLEIGIKLFPDLSDGPPPLAIKYDLSLADTLEAQVVAVTVIPERMNKAALDSISRTLDRLRGDSTQLIVTMGYESTLLPGANFSETRRIAAIGEIVRILRPDILVPAKDPYDAGRGAAGLRPLEFWSGYLSRAAAEAKRVRPRTRIGVAVSQYGLRDSLLYSWAASRGSPIDVVGFTLYPTETGVKTLDAARDAADRWMAESASTKDHWVFAVGGFPEAHGELSQERAVWSALAWATTRPLIKGVIVAEAGDYGTIRGIRAADGHLRLVAFAIMRAKKGLREAAAPDSTPAALRTQQRVGG